MRHVKRGRVNNAFRTMTNDNKEYIYREIIRHSSAEARSYQYRRNGFFNFHGLQLNNSVEDNNYAIMGEPGNSPIVGL